MSRKVVRLTLDRLSELDTGCAGCLFWQLDPVSRGRVSPQDAPGEKEAWVSQVLRDWGSCGRLALVDDRPVGYLIYAPAAFLPGAGAFPTAPVSPDAVLLTHVYVDPRHAGGGLGRMLVQGMARDLIQRGGIRAVEAFGSTRGDRHDRHDRGHRGERGDVAESSSQQRVDRCLVPADFLGSVGFKTQRAHGRTPRMRMQLRSALSWRDEVEAALERLVGAVRPAPKPAPQPSPRDAPGLHTDRSSERN